MSALPFWHVDAFVEDAPFSGNPAAVVVLPQWPDDAWMQAVAGQNALSETAFLVKEAEGWRVRWFTPRIEVDLCGHATLASAWVVLNHVEPGERVVFASRSGPLAVIRDGDRLVLDFPANPPRPAVFPEGLDRILGAPAREVLATRDHLLCVLDDADRVSALVPDMAGVVQLNRWGLIVTAPGGGGVDFVSRFFAPRKGVDEDPVTGSAHCVLAPFWARRLDKAMLTARQLSRRGGTLWLENRGERVLIGGRARPFVQGQLIL
ncbi:PhzF family phenazine biosynthesis protein [Paramagnetospirillum magneticum]|uniref:Predicted epimerase, PhzC/PhzF homolog n=1 Tax=Paramagnetospirillum magneticum (strain ATCC 700264 / AMB-1) TaxID=342108 RepID=Q2W2C5_PARM1|nr:PhzF family phenazine biosynthesis protein [Paramagnetospirillum magneticum]BAE52000.1 Predicted epimerase, PhzC/PhzF homolog [Paramagnetospirillum magneticum AMB-1]